MKCYKLLRSSYDAPLAFFSGLADAKRWIKANLAVHLRPDCALVKIDVPSSKDGIVALLNLACATLDTIREPLADLAARFAEDDEAYRVTKRGGLVKTPIDKIGL